MADLASVEEAPNSAAHPDAGQAADPWAHIVGQPEAVRSLRAAVASAVHAYLFVGPDGVGKREAAHTFAAELLGVSRPNTARGERGLGRPQTHPDILAFAPQGNQLRLGSQQDRGEVYDIITEASRSPLQSARKVLIIEQFQTAEPPACSALLKVIEEPPESVIFVLLATEVPAHQVTIESRCLRIDFQPLGVETIVDALVAQDSVPPKEARVAATSANGNLARARLLAKDPYLAKRRDAWWSIPDRLKRSGFVVSEIVDELRGLIDDASADVLAKKHQEELKELEQVEAQYGQIAGRRRTLETRQKREVRRFRTEELRFGFAILSGRFREMIVSGQDSLDVDGQANAAFEAVDELGRANLALRHNPNEALLLQALLLRLSPSE